MLSIELIFIYLLFAITNLIIGISCHARLLVPISRSSAWRQNPILFPTFYTDNAMSCGGYRRFWLENGISF